ncbi:MAG: hypothetical protein M1429_03775 [Patescibacteria group bacterium]|nr:hypothetical protein [Patescibacteria group bacterium]
MEFEKEDQKEVVKDAAGELTRRRELGELDSADYEINYLFYLQELGMPISKEDVKNQAIVINPDQFEVLGYIDLVNTDGESITIDFDDVDSSRPFILFPEDLGNLRSES